ncbi:unnamed protein product [Camellia sinensis]
MEEKEDRPVELHEREVTRLRSEKGSRLWIGIETGIETVTSRVEARGGDEIMNTGLLVILLRSGPPVATAPQFEPELRPQGKLTVTVVKANDLKNMEMIGKSDPYVVVYIRPLFKVKTEVIDNDLNPIWNQTFELIAEDKETQSLILEGKGKALMSIKASFSNIATVLLDWDDVHNDDFFAN